MNTKADPYATKLQKRVDALLIAFIVIVIALVVRSSAHGAPKPIFSGTIATVHQPFWSTLALFSSPHETNLRALAQYQAGHDGARELAAAGLAGSLGDSESNSTPMMLVEENHKPTFAVATQPDEPAPRFRTSSAPSSLGPVTQIAGIGSALSGQAAATSSLSGGNLIAGTDARDSSTSVAGAVEAGPRYVGEEVKSAVEAGPRFAGEAGPASSLGQGGAANTTSSFSLHAESAPAAASSLVPSKSSLTTGTLKAQSIGAPDQITSNSWSGGGSAPFNWSDSANWGGAQPGYGTISFSGSLGNTNTMDQSYNMNQINWNGSSAWTMNSSNSAVLNLFDNGGTQAKVESLGSGGVTINAPITFAATTGNAWGEINAVSSSITFGTGTLTVNGSAVAGIRMFGGTGGISTTFNNTVSASGKYFSTSAVGQTVNIGGAFTLSDFYVMNTGVLNLNSGGTLTGNVRLGGDFATTGTQDLTKSGVFNLAATAGGQTFSGVVNSVASNTSGALAVNSQNTSNTNTLSGHIALDSNLTISQATGGTLAITQGRTTAGGTTAGTDIKTLTLTFNTVGTGAITVGPGGTAFGTIYDSTSGSGGTGIIKTGTGTLSFNDANSYRGTTIIKAGTLFVGANSALGSSNGTVGTTGNTVLLGDTTGSSNANLLTTGAFTIANVLSLQSGNTGVMTLGGNSAGASIYSGVINLGSIASAVAAKDGTFVALSGGSVDFQGVIQEGTTNTTNANVTIGDATHSGTVKFSNAGSFNTYTGSTTIGNGATLEVVALAAGGTNSSIGNSTGAAANLVLDNGTLSYTGTTAQGTSRFFTIGAGGATFDASSSNNSALTFTGAGAGSIVASGSGDRTLTLTGSSTGANAMSNIIVNPGTGATSVTKSGAGTWTLTGTNTYTGGTTISLGTLALTTNNAGFGTGTVAIGASGTANITFSSDANIANVFTGTGTITAAGSTGAVTFSNASGLNGFTGTLNVNTTGGKKVAVSAAGEKIGSGATVNITSGSTLYLNTSTASNDGVTFNVVGSGNTENLGAIRIESGSVIGATSSVVLGGNTSLGSNSGIGTINAAITQSTASAVTKVGTGTVVLGGANTYTGTTTISAGTLQLGNGGTTGSLSTSSAIVDNATLTINRSNAVTQGTDFSGAAITGTGAFVQAGTGTTTLNAANTYTGSTNVNGGTLNYFGSLAAGGSGGSPITNSAINIGVAGGGNAVMNLQAGSSVTLSGATENISVGNGVGGAGQGFLYQSGGTLTKGTYTQLTLGTANGTSYGYYNLSGGTANISEADIGGFNGTSTGVLDMSGGTLNVSDWLIASRSTGSGAIGIFNQTGGTLNYTFGTGAQAKSNWGSNGTAIFNIAGTVTAANADFDLNQSSNATNFGEINLLTGGTLQVHSIAANSANGTKLVNFNGGTLKANTATATFITTNNTAVNVFSGGGTIDNNGVAITIPVGLLAASGNGVTSAAVNSGGTGYLGAPAVTFSGGGGTGAAGYAVVSGGVITSIVITNPGTGYTSAPTITLTGGGGSGATLGTIATAANASGGITFAGTGTTALTAASTYTGTTTINASSTLQLGSAGTTGALSASSSILDNGTLTINRTNAVAQGTDFSSAAITGSGAFIQAGSGTTTLNVANTFTGATTLSAGTLSVADTSYLGGTSANNSLVFNGGTLQVTGTTMTDFGSHTPTFTATKLVGLDINNAANNFTISQNLNQTTGGLTKLGAGTLTLSGSNTYAGATTVSGGTLSITGGNSGGGSYSVSPGGTLTINSSGTVSASSLTMGTTGTTTANLNGGILLVGSGGIVDGTFNAGTALNFNGGTLKSSAAFTVGAGLPINILAGGATIDSTGGNITFTSGLAFAASPGSITIQGGNTVTVSDTAANESGSFTVTGTGTKWTLNGASGTTSAGLLTINTGATVDMKAFTFTTGGLAGAGTLTDSGAAAVFTITGSGSNSFSGAITGAAALTMSGAGTQTLSGANNYTGATTISGGTLKNGSATTFTGSNTALSMSSTGIFDLGGFNASVSSISAMASTNTITNSGGADATLSLAAQASLINLSGLFTDGATNKLAINMTNANAASSFLNSGNTFSGGLNLLNGTGSGTRLYVNTAISFAGTPGALTSSNFGTGTITIGTTGTDKAGIRFDTAASGTLANAIVFNTALGTDVAGISSNTTSGVTLAGAITANSNAAFNTAATNAKLTVSGAISGSGGVVVTQSTGTGGIVTLSGANTYTGATTLSAGTLQMAGTGSLGNTAIGVTGASSTFAVNTTSGSLNLGTTGAGTAGATLSLGASTTFTMVDGLVGTTNLQQNTSFASTALTLGGTTLNLELNSTAADLLAVTKTAAVSGTNTINLTTLGTSLTAGTYNLLTATSGLTGTFQFGNGFQTQTVNLSGNAYTLTLANSTSAESVTVAALAAGALTWTGQASGNGANNSNWTTVATDNNWANGALATNYVNGTPVLFQDTNTVTGSNVTNGTVTIQAAGVTPTSVTFNNSAVNYTVSNASGAIGIAGSGGITKSGTGTVTLSSQNTYTGTTTISGGTLAVSNNNQLGANAAAISLNGGTLQMNLAVTAQTNTHVITVGASGGTINISQTSGTPTYIMGNAGNLTGSGTLTVTGNGTLGSAGVGADVLVLNNANAGYTGNVILQSGGIIEYGNAGGVGTGATFTVGNLGMLETNNVTISNAVTVNAGGTLEFGNTNTGVFSGPITLNGAATVRMQDWFDATVRNGTISGAIGGGSGLTINNGTVGGTTGTLFLTNTTNNYTGATTITSGTLSLGDGTTNGDIAGTTSIVDNSALIFNRNTSTSFTSGLAISGTGTVTKSGAGTQTLSGNNTYTGATAVNAGTLILSGSNAASATSVSGTLQLANANATTGVLTLNNGATLQLRADADTTFNVASIAQLNNDPTTGTDIFNLNIDVNAASSGSNKTLTLAGNIVGSSNSGHRGADVTTINVTGGNGYTLALGQVIGENSDSGTTMAFNVASGVNLNVAGFQQQGGNVGGQLSFAGAGNTTVSGAINKNSARSLNVNFNQTGTVTLNVGANGANGTPGSALNAGTTVFNNAAALNNAQINLGNQTALSTADATFLLGGSTGFNGGLTYTGAVRPFDTTSGLLTIGGQNTSGTNTYSAGLQLGNTLNTGKSVNLVAAAGGEVDFTGVIAKNGTDTTAGVTINGAYTVNGATVNPTGIVKLTNVNTYAGGTTVNGGTLQLGNATNTLADAGAVNVGNGNGAILDLLNHTDTVGALTLNKGTVQSTGGAGTLTTSGVTVSGTPNTISSGASVVGVIAQNAGSLLTVNGTAGADTLANGATSLAGTGTVGAVTLSGGGNDISSAGTLTTGGLTVNGTGNTLSSGTVVGSATLGSGASFTDNGALTGNVTQGTSSALTVNGTVSGSDSLGTSASLSGTGTVSGAISLTGSDTLSSSGTLTGSSTLGVSGVGNSISSGIVSIASTTTVNSGAGLSVNGTLSGAGAVSVSGTLSGTGTVSKLVTVNSGGHLAPGNSVGTLTLALLTLSNGSILDYEFNGTPANDFTNVTTSGGLTFGTAGFNLYDEGTVNTYSTNGTYNLIGYTGSLNGSVVSDLSVLNQVFGKSYTFGATGSNITLTIGTVATSATAYWKGTVSNAWNGTSGVTSNFTTDLAGTANLNSLVGSTTDVFFTSTGGSQVTSTLGQDFTINSLTFNNNANGSTNIGAGNTLTLNAGSGVGITVDSGSGAHTIAANVALGADQTWTNNSASALTVSGGIADGGSTLTVAGGGDTAASGVISGSGGLTKSGAGTLTLSGGAANTYTGLTTVSTGTLLLNKTGVNAIASNVGGGGNDKVTDILINGGTLKLNQSNQIVDSASINLTSGTFDLNGKSETIYDFNNNGGAFKTGRGGSFVVTDPVWSTGSNDIYNNTTFGNLEVSGGTNIIHGDETSGFGAGTVTVGSGGLLFSGNGSPNITVDSDDTAAGSLILNGDVSFTGASGTASITNGNARDINNNDLGSLGSNNGTLDLGGANRTFTVANGSAATDMNISAQVTNGSLTKAGAGLLALSTANTYAGTTTIDAGTLQANAANALGSTSAITVNATGTLLISNNLSTDHVSDTAPISGAGGTIAISTGVSEGVANTKVNGSLTGSSSVVGLGALTLASNSTIDFSSLGNSTLLVFASFTPGGNILSITNWTNSHFDGTLNSGLSTDDRLVFATSQAANLGFFDFGPGLTATQIALDGNFFEVGTTLTPVPEPSTWVAGALALLAVGYTQRRRLRGRPRVAAVLG